MEPKPRNTFNNLVYYLRRSDFVEIAKILRRRVLNLIRFFKLALLRLIGFYYYHPAVEKRRNHKRLYKVLARTFDWTEQNDDKARLRVAIIARDGDSYPKSSAFIRLVSPLTDKTIRDKVQIELYSENTKTLPVKYDACIVQRNAFDSLKQAEALVRFTSKHGVVLVVDTDDAFHSIDTAHPEHDRHRSTLETFDYLVKNADQVWVSTQHLADYFDNVNKHVVVVPNTLDRRLWKSQPPKPKHDSPLQFLYMGTVSHNADFNMIFPALDAAASKYPGSFELTIIGVSDSLPDRDWIKRVYQKRGGSLYPRFIPWLCDQGPFDVGLSPLVENEFNAGKSDIKCLDYMALGAMPVVSDIKPYQSPEISPYIIKIANETDAWRDGIFKLVAKPDEYRRLRSKSASKATEYIWKKRSSTLTAKRQLKLLRSAVKENKPI